MINRVNKNVVVNVYMTFYYLKICKSLFFIDQMLNDLVLTPLLQHIDSSSLMSLCSSSKSHGSYLEHHSYWKHYCFSKYPQHLRNKSKSLDVQWEKIAFTLDSHKSLIYSKYPSVLEYFLTNSDYDNTLLMSALLNAIDEDNTKSFSVLITVADYVTLTQCLYKSITKCSLKCLTMILHKYPWLVTESDNFALNLAIDTRNIGVLTIILSTSDVDPIGKYSEILIKAVKTNNMDLIRLFLMQPEVTRDVLSEHLKFFINGVAVPTMRMLTDYTERGIV